MQKIYAIEEGKLIPDYLVLWGEVIATGFEGVRAGGGVYHDGIFSMFRPFPHLRESLVQGCLICGFISLGREWHATTMSGGVGGDVEVYVGALGDGEEGFIE